MARAAARAGPRWPPSRSRPRLLKRQAQAGVDARPTPRLTHHLLAPHHQTSHQMLPPPPTNTSQRTPRRHHPTASQAKPTKPLPLPSSRAIKRTSEPPPPERDTPPSPSEPQKRATRTNERSTLDAPFSEPCRQLLALHAAVGGGPLAPARRCCPLHASMFQAQPEAATRANHHMRSVGVGPQPPVVRPPPPFLLAGISQSSTSSLSLFTPIALVSPLRNFVAHPPTHPMF